MSSAWTPTATSGAFRVHRYGREGGSIKRSPFSRARVVAVEVQWAWDFWRPWLGFFRTEFLDGLLVKRAIACAPPLTKPAFRAPSIRRGPEEVSSALRRPGERTAAGRTSAANL